MGLPEIMKDPDLESEHHILINEDEITADVTDIIDSPGSTSIPSRIKLVRLRGGGTNEASPRLGGWAEDNSGKGSTSKVRAEGWDEDLVG